MSKLNIVLIAMVAIFVGTIGLLTFNKAEAAGGNNVSLLGKISGNRVTFSLASTGSDVPVIVRIGKPDNSVVTMQVTAKQTPTILFDQIVGMGVTSVQMDAFGQPSAASIMLNRPDAK